MKNLLYLIACSLLISCSGESNESIEEENENSYIPLPFLGQHEFDGADTLYHVVPPYYLLAHDSSEFTNERVAGKIHVVNFFFTSCGSICPAMITQMGILQEKTADIEELIFLSHTIDPVRDTIPKLQAYIAEREIDTKNWFFLWGEQEYVHDLGQDGYIVNAMEDDKADGGFLHSEHFVLIDREGHVRGLYDGTNPEDIDLLDSDIRRLIDGEYTK